MPWAVFQQGSEYCIFKLDAENEKTGESIACHPSRSEAQKQIAALYANEKKGVRRKEWGARFKFGRRHNKADNADVQSVHDLALKLGAQCPFMVTKGADGKLRWVLISTSTFEDRDGEVVSQKAQDEDTDYLNSTGDFGPLRYWHIGQPKQLKENDYKSVIAGPGVDIGDCDFSAMHGKLRIESGTFRDEEIGASIKAMAGEFDVSIGFSHPATEPDKRGIFSHTHTFERSLIPLAVAKGSNLFTAVPYVGKDYTMNIKERVDEFLSRFGAKGESVLSTTLDTAEKMETEGVDAGIRHKEGEANAVPPAGTPPEAPSPSVVGDMTPDEFKAWFGKEFGGLLGLESKMRGIVEEAFGTRKKEADEIATALKESQAKDAEILTALKAVTTSQEENGKRLAALEGDLPRALAQGHRATQDPANVVPPTDPRLKDWKPSGDPIAALVDRMDGAPNGPVVTA